MTAVTNRDPLRLAHSRKGHEQFSSTDGWGQSALCKDDSRYIERGLEEIEIDELIAKCRRCPVQARCLLWAEAQTQPVGFVVAGGRRWKAWNHCAICGKKVRGIDRCPAHYNIELPIGIIEPDGTGRVYLDVQDNH